MSSKYRIHFTSVYSFSLTQYLAPVTPFCQPVHLPLYPTRMPAKQPEKHSENDDTHPDGTLKGGAYEPRQTGKRKEDWRPRPERSLGLDEARSSLLEDVLMLYGGMPTVQRVKRYTRDAVYDDPLSYATDRYQIAAQWFALPRMCVCENQGYEVVKDQPEILQFKNRMKWRFSPLLPGSITVNSLVTLALDPDTADTDYPLIKYHKDQASEKDYTHTGLGQKIKEWQAKGTAWMLTDENMKEFEADRGAGEKEEVPCYA